MFLSCFDVKIDKWISENSETSKTKDCAKSFVLECTEKQQIWWEMMNV